MEFKNVFFHSILNQYLKWNLNLYSLREFKIMYLNEILIIFYKTALFAAVKNENIDIVKFLLTNDQIDVNLINKIHLFLFHSVLMTNLIKFINFYSFSLSIVNSI